MSDAGKEAGMMMTRVKIQTPNTAALASRVLSCCVALLLLAGEDCRLLNVWRLDRLMKKSDIDLRSITRCSSSVLY